MVLIFTKLCARAARRDAVLADGLDRLLGTGAGVLSKAKVVVGASVDVIVFLASET